MLKRVVDAVQVVALAAVALALLLLFYRPPAPKAAVSTGPASAGATVFAGSCSGCHGSRGEGGIGPKLAGGTVVRAFPDPADEVAVVRDGFGGMPAWKDRLTPDQIAAVVEYTRTKL